MTRRLITIGISHYCEKARWALERAGLAFVEEPHPPLLHVASAWRAAGGRTVPVLVEGSTRLADSSEILAHVDASLPPEQKLYPSDEGARAEVERWEDRFDEVLGPHVRRFVYAYMLDDPAAPGFLVHGASRRSAALYRATRPLVHGLMRRAMRITPAGAERSRAKIDEVFDEVGARLEGRRTLVGERFSAADLTFAALAAPLVLPPAYGAPLPSLEELPAELQPLVPLYRSHPAGAFALRLYTDERGKTQGSG